MSDIRGNKYYGFILLLAVLIILAAAGLRLMEWPAWADPALWLNGEPVLASNDGYAWLAGLDSHGRMQDWPMTRLLSVLARLLPFSAAHIAFFLPAGLAALPGLLMLVLAGPAHLRPAILPAAIVASCGMAFLLRTRLGYAETELFALPASLGLALFWALALRLGIGLNSEWGTPSGPGQDRESKGRTPPAGRVISSTTGFEPLWPWVLITAAWTALAIWAYPSAHPLLLGIILFGALGGCLAGLRLPSLALATAILLISLHGGWPGFLAAIGLVWLIRSGHPHLPRQGLIALFSLALPLALLLALLWGVELWEGSWRRLLAYGGWLPPEGDWSLPSVTESIRETTRAPFSEYGLRLAGHWAWVLPGLAGFAWLARRRPQFLALLPMIGLGLGGYWLGPRFALYALPAIGLGLAFPLAAWLRHRPAFWQWTAQCLLVIALLANTAWLTRDFSPQPVLSTEHARALKTVNDQHAATAGAGAPAGRIWEWWDLGYAAQYYAGLASFSDGGATSRRHSLMLGRVMGAQSADGAAAWMRLARDERAKAEAQARAEGDSGPALAYRHRPLSSVEELNARQARQTLADQVSQRHSETHRFHTGAGEERGEEYLVVSWHALRRAEWISRFARWDLVSGEAGQGQSRILAPPIQFDEQRGLLQTPDGMVRLASMTLFQDGERYHREWPHHGNGQHAVINNDQGEGVLLDTSLYSMMAVQMLLHPPAAFQAQFELVVDHSPHARIYRLR